MVESLDESAGGVLDALERAGVADRTMVVFFSDNGGLRYEATSVRNTSTAESNTASISGSTATSHIGVLALRTPMRSPDTGEGTSWLYCVAA